MNRTPLYVKLTEDELNLLDTCVKTLNYATRTEFATALILSVIHGADLEKTIAGMRSGIKAEFSMRDNFFLILDEYLFPTIAMRGEDYVYRNLKEDLKVWMYQKHRYIPEDTDISQWMHAYTAIKRTEIKTYRDKIILENYEEEHEIKPEVSWED